GNFDDAQSGLKKIFADREVIAQLDREGCFLSSANSINWGRLAPQIVYYMSAYCDMVKAGTVKMGDPINVCVPTGNFGNIFAGILAAEMGLPVRKFICASNKNNILTDFLSTGVYDRKRDFYATMSPSMDILISSNLERLLYLRFGSERTAAWMKQLLEKGEYALTKEDKSLLDTQLTGGWCDEEQTAKTIRDMFDSHHYLADTHTAVALHAARERTTQDLPLLV
ncbi:MAG TPA: threonine synthase, partial [Clostridiales bacterium]|nr:threonine synthase [Clostridiales bacterium]